MRSFTFSVFYRRYEKKTNSLFLPSRMPPRRHIIMHRIKDQHLRFYTANTNKSGVRKTVGKQYCIKTELLKMHVDRPNFEAELTEFVILYVYYNDSSTLYNINSTAINFDFIGLY